MTAPATSPRFGRLLVPSDIAVAAQAHLKLWLVPFLAEVERQRGLSPRTIKEPQSWEVASEFSKFDASKLPSLVVAIDEITGDPVRDGQGEYSAVFPCAVAAIVAGRTPAETLRNAEAYGAAVRGAMLYHMGMHSPELGIRGCKWKGESYTEVDVKDRRTKAASLVFFEIYVPDVARDYVGAPLGTTPPVDPYLAPDALPTVDTTTIVTETP